MEKYGKRIWCKVEYDKATNLYKRFTGGAIHTDLESKEQLTAKVVIILLPKRQVP